VQPATAAPTESQEVEVVTKTGVLPVALRLLRSRGFDGALPRTVAVFQDLREQKAREEQWRRRDASPRWRALGPAWRTKSGIRLPHRHLAQILRRRLESAIPGGNSSISSWKSRRLERIVGGAPPIRAPAARG